MRHYGHRILFPRSHLRGCRSSRRYFQDETLRWAEQDKVEARASLSIPSPRLTVPLLSTLEDYLEQRGWITTGDETHSVALISHVLSAPLTLRYHTEQTIADSLKDAFEICCLGARAEATLPAPYWKEVLMTTKQRTWNIDLIGPDLSPNSDPIRLQHAASQISIQVYATDLFHRMPLNMTKQWDYYLLFNPGLGHPNLKNNWLPTLKSLQGQSFWLTAHSAADAERDAVVLHEEMGIQVDYQPNPFASRITYQDPFDKSHFVSPNKYIARIARDS